MCCFFCCSQAARLFHYYYFARIFSNQFGLRVQQMIIGFGWQQKKYASPSIHIIKVIFVLQQHQQNISSISTIAVLKCTSSSSSRGTLRTTLGIHIDFESIHIDVHTLDIVVALVIAQVAVAAGFLNASSYITFLLVFSSFTCHSYDCFWPVFLFLLLASSDESST